jgi:hypothetical protein
MYLLVASKTKLNFSNGPTGVLPRGVVLHVAVDSPSNEFVVRMLSNLGGEPAPYKFSDGFDFSFSRRVHTNLLEYTTWDSLKAAARMLGRRE